MLLCVRERSIAEKNHNHSSLQRQFSNGHSPKFEAGASAATASGTRISHFLPTSRRIVQFSNGRVCSCNVMIKSCISLHIMMLVYRNESSSIYH